MWFPTKNGKLVKEADEASSQAYRIVFMANREFHCRKIIQALNAVLCSSLGDGKKVARLGKMGVMIQEPWAKCKSPDRDYVVVEYFNENNVSNYAVLAHEPAGDRYVVCIWKFDTAIPEYKRVLKDYGCVNMFDLSKSSSFPEKIG